MSERTCRHCGASLEGRRKGTRYCDTSCRARAWLGLHPDRDSRSGRKGGAKRYEGRSAHTESRQPTRYRVYQVGAAYKLLFRGEVAAHDGPAAIREVANGTGGEYVAIPLRSLQLRDARGR